MSRSNLVVAVLGAGNVGCALAADLVLRGFEVRLFNRTAERLAPIRQAGGISATGMVEGFAKIPVVTDVLSEAVHGVDVVAVTVPTPALPAYAPALATAVTADQVIWLNPDTAEEPCTWRQRSNGPTAVETFASAR